MKDKLILKIDTYNIETSMLSLLLFFMPLSYYLNLIIQNGLNIKISITAIFYFIGFCIGLFSYIIIVIRKSLLSVVVFFIFLFGTGWYLCFYRGYSNLVFTNIIDLAYNPSILLFMYCLPVLYFLICGNIDSSLLLNKMCILGKVILLLFALCFFAFKIGTSSLSIEYMTFSYYALPSICICLLHSSKNRLITLINRSLAMLGLIITLVAGARGALVCNIFFIILLVLFSNRVENSTKIFLCIILIISTIFICFYFNEILSELLAFLNSKGIYSRTISKMTQNSFINADDRNILWEAALDATRKAPLFGYGMWGDRPIVNGYVHNFIIEIICSYGFLFGSILLIIFFSMIFLKFLQSKYIDSNVFELFLISIPMGLIQLMFSGSYLTNIWFFFLLGILYNAKKIRRYNESSFDIQ